MKSEKIDQLAVALGNAQSTMPAIPMNARNPFLNNKYADLGEMIKVATPILFKNGLSISQQATTEIDRIGVTTLLMHTSGQWIESTISLPLGDEKGKSLAQVAGSVITYLRRYSYGSVVGLYTDEDDDGNHKSQTKSESNGNGNGKEIDMDKKYKMLSAEVVKMVAAAKGLSDQDAVKALNEWKAAGKIQAEGIMEHYENAIK